MDVDPRAALRSALGSYRRLPWYGEAALEAAAVGGLYAWQPPVAWALAVVFGLLWVRRLPPFLPQPPARLAGLPEPAVRVLRRPRLLAQGALIAATGPTVPALAVAFAAGFALWWAPARVRRYALPLAAGGLAISYPFYLGDLFEIPIFGSFPAMNTMVVMAIFTMMAIGLNMVVGYAGLLDLGYVAFYAMGAYTVAWLASPQFSDFAVNFGGIGLTSRGSGFHVSIWLLLILAAVLTAIVGVIIGLPTLRLRGDYLAIVTLGFGEIMPQVARNGDNFFGTGFNLTNGPQGITPIDAPGFGKTLHDAVPFLPVDYRTDPDGTNLFYWTALGLLLFTVFCSIRLRDSRLGRAWIAIREDETAAAAMGVPLMRTKTWSYAAGAFFGGIAGAFYASFKFGAFPDDFYFNISVFILCMVILGGMGNVWGVIVGAAFLAYLDREGLANTGAWINDKFGTNIDVPLYSFGIYGAIILVIMLFRPEGLMPSARRRAELHEAEEEEQVAVEAAR